MKHPMVALEKLGIIQTGSTPSTADDTFWGGDFPFVTPSELDQPEPVIATSRTLTAEGVRQARVIKRDAVMVCCIGSLGKVGMAGRSVVTNQQINSVEFNPELIYPRYGFYACQMLKPKLAVMAPATTVPIVNKSKFGQLVIPCPSLPEQRRIAAILDRADALRAKRREALAQLDKLAQAIFVEMFGEYREGCIKWPIKRFDEITSETKIGLVRSAEEFGSDFETPYVRMNAVGNDGKFYPNLVQRTNVTPSEAIEYRLKVGDLLFNTRNSKELVGKTAIFREEGHYVYNNNLMRIRFLDSIEPEYVAAAFLTRFVQRELEMRKSGTTSVFAIYGRELKSLPIPLPPLLLQQEFSKRIASITLVQKSHLQALTALENLFCSLQHRAFRGEL